MWLCEGHWINLLKKRNANKQEIIWHTGKGLKYNQGVNSQSQSGLGNFVNQAARNKKAYNTLHWPQGIINDQTVREAKETLSTYVAARNKKSSDTLAKGVVNSDTFKEREWRVDNTLRQCGQCGGQCGEWDNLTQQRSATQVQKSLW